MTWLNNTKKLQHTLQLTLAISLPLVAQQGFAHFQELLPQTQIVTPATGRTLNFDIVFTHPMEGGPTMDMDKPSQAGVMVNGEHRDLLDTLTPATKAGKQAYTMSYKVRRPGTYQFYMQQAPYYDATEDAYIKQNAKVVVDAFGAAEGWHTPVGLPSEIIPLTRPFAGWTNTSFTGVVVKEGKPQAGVEIEVEYLNSDGVAIPSDAFINQVVITNQNGEFSFTMPRAGWWGFAALMDADYTLKGPDGQNKPVSEDAVLWLQVTDMENR